MSDFSGSEQLIEKETPLDGYEHASAPDIDLTALIDETLESLHQAGELLSLENRQKLTINVEKILDQASHTDDDDIPSLIEKFAAIKQAADDFVERAQTEQHDVASIPDELPQDELSSVASPSVPDEEPDLAPEPEPISEPPAPPAPPRDPSLAEEVAAPETTPEPNTLDKIKAATSYDDLIYLFSNMDNSLWHGDKLLPANEMQDILINAKALLERGSSLSEAQAQLQKIESNTVRTKAMELLAELAASLPPQKKSALDKIKELFTGQKSEHTQLIKDISAAETFSALADLLAHNDQIRGVAKIRTHLLEAYELLQKNQTAPSPDLTQAASKEIFAITNADIREKVKTLLMKEFNINQAV